MAQREAAEKALLTGITMRESSDVKKDKVAHREYQRVIKILTAIGKNDALFESVINDYCRLESDIQRYRELRNELENDETVSGSTRYELIAKYDMQIEKYRKQRPYTDRVATVCAASGTPARSSALRCRRRTFSLRRLKIRNR